MQGGEIDSAVQCVTGNGLEMNATEGGVLLEDDVNGVELGRGRKNARDAWQRVEDGAEALAGGGFRDDAVGARCANELRDTRAE
jgi:hypothetical protein